MTKHIYVALPEEWIKAIQHKASRLTVIRGKCVTTSTLIRETLAEKFGFDEHKRKNAK